MAETLLADFLRGNPEKKPDEYKPPASMFAAPGRVQSAALYRWRGEAGKVFLGVIDGTMQLDDKRRRFVAGGVPVGVRDDRHHMVIAGSRAGKGRAAILPNMLHYPGSVLATDLKGELATVTARRRREGLRQDVFVIDPFGVAQGYPRREKLLAGFNPIAAMRESHLIEDAALIADALVVVAGKDPTWDENARSFIQGVILHVKTSPAYDGRRSLLTVQELIFGRPGALAADMQKNEAAEGAIQAAAIEFLSRPENEGGSVLSAVRRHVKFLDLFKSDNGRIALESHDLDLNALKTKATTVYLCLPARHISTCNRWLRLFVNMTLQSMEQFTPSLPGNAPVLCMLDEFAALGHMAQIEAAAGQIAGFGVKLYVVLQDLAQLKALYEARWETFMGNAGVIQFFGNNDLTTLEWISKRLGKTSIEVMRQSELTNEQRNKGLTGKSTSAEVYELVTVDEAGRYFGRDDPKLRQLVIWAGREEPFLVLQRAYYDKHETCAGLWDDPPGAA